MSSNEEFNNDNVDEIFIEMVSQDQLKDISEILERETDLGVKELLLMQQAFSEAISNISEIIIEVTGKKDESLLKDETCSELLGSLYKICEDFNTYVLEYYSEDAVVFILEDYDDEDGDDEEDEENEDGTEI